MSIGPDGNWQPGGHPPPYPPGPPPGAYGPGAPAVLAPPSPHPAANWRWRVLHSWWLLLPIVGCGCLGGFGFLYVGLRARRKAWWIAGIVYTVLGWAAVFLSDSRSDSIRGDIAAGLAMAIWATAVVHALLINSAWLRWQAEHRPWYQQPHGWGPGQPPVGPHGGGVPGPPGPLFSGYPPPAPGFPPASSGFPPAAVPPPPSAPPAGPWKSPVPPPVSGAPAGPVSAMPAPPVSGVPAGPPSAMPAPPVSAPPGGSTVDVNTATAGQFAALPGFDPARVHRVLAERDSRRGFGSVAEFVAAANLAPHEYAPLRGVLVCGPPPVQPGSGHGRVLDF